MIRSLAFALFALIASCAPSDVAVVVDVPNPDLLARSDRMQVFEVGAGDLARVGRCAGLVGDAARGTLDARVSMTFDEAICDAIADPPALGRRDSEMAIVVVLTGPGGLPYAVGCAEGEPQRWGDTRVLPLVSTAAYADAHPILEPPPACSIDARCAGICSP